MERCATELPPRFDVGDGEGHWAACWLYDGEVHTS
jgi:peptide/nickel transport system ATP-binding protein